MVPSCAYDGGENFVLGAESGLDGVGRVALWAVHGLTYDLNHDGECKGQGMEVSWRAKNNANP